MPPLRYLEDGGLAQHFGGTVPMLTSLPILVPRINFAMRSAALSEETEERLLTERARMGITLRAPTIRELGTENLLP